VPITAYLYSAFLIIASRLDDKDHFKQICVVRKPSEPKTDQLYLVRSLKPLRIIKLLKAFKIIGVLKEELASVIGLTTVKMLALFGYLVSSVHVCACGFWRAKLESNTPEQLEEFLLIRHADPEVRHTYQFS
jgi:hypothetical protein